MSLDLTKADIFPIKCNTKYSGFVGTVNMTVFLMHKKIYWNIRQLKVFSFRKEFSKSPFKVKLKQRSNNV